MKRRLMRLNTAILIAFLPMLLTLSTKARAFRLLWTQEATIADIQAAIRSKDLTCRQLVQMYLDRIEAYDKKGPALNAIIMINPERAGHRRRRSTHASRSRASSARSTASR